MSQVNVADQAVSFLLAVALGAAAAVFYCFFCALRQAGFKRPLQIFVQDMAFWLVLMVVTFCFFLIRCRGEIRGFVYIGELAGFVLLRLVAGKYIIKLFLWLISFFRLCLRPPAAFFALVSRLAVALGGKIGNFGKKVGKKIRKWLKRGLKAESELLYNDQDIGA